MSQPLLVVMSIAAILIIGNALIVCHELGHYLAARSVGLVAERFTVGFGPNLLRLTDRRGTIWSLSALPLGGFVSFAGERDRGRAGGYAALRPTSRMLIVLAGPAANLLVAIVLYAFILAGRGEITLLPIVSTIAAGSPATQAGLQQGDLILAANGRPVTTFAELGGWLRDYPYQTVDLRVQRHGRDLDVMPHLQARQLGHRTVGYLGIEAHALVNRPLSLGQIMIDAPARAWNVIMETVSGIAGAITTGQGAGQFTGMLGVAHLAGEAVRERPLPTPRPYGRPLDQSLPDESNANPHPRRRCLPFLPFRMACRPTSFGKGAGPRHPHRGRGDRRALRVVHASRPSWVRHLSLVLEIKRR